MWTVVKIHMFVVLHFLLEIAQNLLQKVNKIDSTLGQKAVQKLVPYAMRIFDRFWHHFGSQNECKKYPKRHPDPKKIVSRAPRVAQASPPCPPSPSGHHIVHFLLTFSLFLLKNNKFLTKQTQILRFLEIKDSTNSIN